MASTLCVVERPTRVAWEGRARGVYARHLWTLELAVGRTIVATAESFDGPLVRVLRPLMRRTLQKGLDEALTELKAAAEASE